MVSKEIKALDLGDLDVETLTFGGNASGQTLESLFGETSHELAASCAPGCSCCASCCCCCCY
ncbi:hypothetical protein [Rhizohabitans arisaemae]|uniref:hypothetical protein n=1 Tax=Rhizohabitans arisaemae TaxID=2720610 RepID=UPI0024B26E74|nr:hypothetical protein [Rhizohabitans arisaemae]